MITGNPRHFLLLLVLIYGALPLRYAVVFMLSGIMMLAGPDAGTAPSLKDEMFRVVAMYAMLYPLLYLACLSYSLVCLFHKEIRRIRYVVGLICVLASIQFYIIASLFNSVT